jgi:hypothetical protein
MFMITMMMRRRRRTLVGVTGLSCNISLLIKVKLSLCLTKHHAIKTYWGSGGIAPRILDFGTTWR